MSNESLICARCGEVIAPGDEVDIIGIDTESRILLGEDVIIVHVGCRDE